jgi:hypothetical protein
MWRVGKVLIALPGWQACPSGSPDRSLSPGTRRLARIRIAEKKNGSEFLLSHSL